MVTHADMKSDQIYGPRKRSFSSVLTEHRKEESWDSKSEKSIGMVVVAAADADV